MARLGNDSEWAAMIYQHEARGADQAITSAIDSHVQVEQSRREDGNGQASVFGPRGLMARKINNRRGEDINCAA
jgi:hypothetical protein